MKTFGQSCTLITLRAEEFVLTSVNSVVIAELVVMFLEGLGASTLLLQSQAQMQVVMRNLSYTFAEHFGPLTASERSQSMTVTLLP